jgi:hypothetical protein
MDEVFGYFPPSAMPPSKLPLLTLMKQARAFGLGVVLATQNPVDLDYKGLSNAGTWFIGRLQTERDKSRVIEGLLGTEAAAGLDRAGIEALISNLAQRTFLMRNVHDDAPVLFRTRWALSYLRGPMTLAELSKLTGDVAAPAPRTAASTPAPAGAGKGPAAGVARPVVQPGVTEKFLVGADSREPLVYQPFLGAIVRAHFVDAKSGMDAWESWHYLAPVGADGPDWAAAEVVSAKQLELSDAPKEGASFAEVPAGMLSPRGQRGWARELEDHVYRTASVQVFACPSVKMKAAPGGTEQEFRSHLAAALRERRDDAVDTLRRKYAAKITALEDRARRADQKLEREKTQASSQTMSSALSVGGSLLGALFGGRRSGAMSKASAAARSVGRASKERADVAHAQADAAAIRQQVEEMESQLESEVAALEAEFDPRTARVETVAVKPRKSDIEVADMALVWRA